MTLPKEIVDFIQTGATREGCAYPGPTDELFNQGILDSFDLVDFVTMIEEHCHISIPDEDVNRANFTNLETIEKYIAQRQASD